MHAASGLFAWRAEPLTFASRQFATKIVDLSVRFTRFIVYNYSLCAKRLRSVAQKEIEAPLHLMPVVVVLGVVASFGLSFASVVFFCSCLREPCYQQVHMV